MQKTPIKISWTVISNWMRGDVDNALMAMAGLPTPTNPAMEEGSRLHKIIAEKRLKLIPELTDKAEYEDIQPEKGIWKNYYKVKLFDWLYLSGVIDVYEPSTGGIVVDWKSGRKKSSEHPKEQVYLYALICQLEGIPVSEGIFARIEGVDEEAVICTDYSVIKITPKKIEHAKNLAETVGSEIYAFLEENGLLDKEELKAHLLDKQDK